MTSTPRSESYYSIPPSIADAPETAGGLGARLSNTISSYLFESVLSIQASPARLPTDKRKTPLSLPQTTANFRQFVQKSGPLFYFQDAVEATLLWDDWSWTVMWMGIWAVIGEPHQLLFSQANAHADDRLSRPTFSSLPLSPALRPFVRPLHHPPQNTSGSLSAHACQCPGAAQCELCK